MSTALSAFCIGTRVDGVDRIERVDRGVAGLEQELDRVFRGSEIDLVSFDGSVRSIAGVSDSPDRPGACSR